MIARSVRRPDRRRDARRVRTAGLAAFLLLLTSGCGTGDSPTTAVTAAPGVSTPAGPTQAMLGKIGLTQSDLPAGYGPNVMQQGDVVEGQVSLDLCGADFPSELLRVARHQVAFEGPAGRLLANENLAYSPGGAQQAMSELRTARAQCPTTPVDPVVAGTSATTWVFDDVPVRLSWQKDTMAVGFATSADGGLSFTGTMVYQRRGEVIAALYLTGVPPSDPQVTALANLLSSRLAATIP